MTRYVAFLRGINVGGHAIVKMDELRRIFSDAGCADVGTYIQSGNVIFGVPDAKAAAVRRKIQTRLHALLGEKIEIAFRASGELAQFVRASPFSRLKLPADAKLYVTFLTGEPRARPEFPLHSPREALQAVAMLGLDVFTVSLEKNGRYGFPNNFIEKELGVPGTTRNWTTVSRLVELSS